MFAAFDLDSTLIASNKFLEKVLGDRGFRLSSPKTAFRYDFDEGYAPPPDWQWDLFFYKLFTERYDEIGPVDSHVYEFLRECYGDGREPIRIITSRPRGILMYHSIESHLERLFPDIDFSIDIVSNPSDKKSRYMSGCDIMFEDRRRTSIKMAREGYIVFMKRYEYNALPSVIDGIDFVYPVDMFQAHTVMPKTIITFNDYGQLLDMGVSRFVAPV
jgi:hypothetical protein